MNDTQTAIIPGELKVESGDIELNAGLEKTQIKVANLGDRPVQIGSHYHFYEVNPSLEFERDKALGKRLDIAAGTAVRFEPGQSRSVELVEFGGAKVVYGFQGKVMGAINKENG